MTPDLSPERLRALAAALETAEAKTDDAYVTLDSVVVTLQALASRSPTPPPVPSAVHPTAGAARALRRAGDALANANKNQDPQLVLDWDRAVVGFEDCWDRDVSARLATPSPAPPALAGGPPRALYERHGELASRLFTSAGLTPAEHEELDALRRDIDRQEGIRYPHIAERLEGMLEAEASAPLSAAGPDFEQMFSGFIATVAEWETDTTVRGVTYESILRMLGKEARIGLERWEKLATRTPSPAPAANHDRDSVIATVKWCRAEERGEHHPNGQPCPSTALNVALHRLMELVGGYGPPDGFGAPPSARPAPSTEAPPPGVTPDMLVHARQDFVPAPRTDGRKARPIPPVPSVEAPPARTLRQRIESTLDPEAMRRVRGIDGFKDMQVWALARLVFCLIDLLDQDRAERAARGG